MPTKEYDSCDFIRHIHPRWATTRKHPTPYGYYGETPEAYGYYGEPAGCLRSTTAKHRSLWLLRRAPEAYGYYGEAPEAYGYYGEPPDAYGYYGEAPEYGYYGEAPEAYGYYGEPPDAYGYYGEAPEPYGYYGQAPETYGYYGEATRRRTAITAKPDPRRMRLLRPRQPIRLEGYLRRSSTPTDGRLRRNAGNAGLCGVRSRCRNIPASPITAIRISQVTCAQAPPDLQRGLPDADQRRRASRKRSRWRAT